MAASTTHPMADENRLRRAVQTWTITVTSTTDTIVVANKAGETGKRHYVTYVSGTWDDTPTGKPSMLLLEGSTIKMNWFIGEEGFSESFEDPVEIALGEDAKLQVNAGGTGVRSKVNMVGFTV